MSRSFEVVSVAPIRASAAQNMADDILLQTYAGEHGCAILRHYNWSDPEAVTFGRYQKLSEVNAVFQSSDFMRRPTGGGVVEHAKDALTWSFAIPREALDTDRVQVIFRSCQASIRQSLQEITHATLAHSQSQETRPGECFAHPVEHDLLSEDGAKVSGIAMHRSKTAILLQGSIQLESVQFSEADCARLLNRLSEDICNKPIEKQVELSTLLEPAESAAQHGQIQSDAWLQARP